MHTNSGSYLQLTNTTKDVLVEALGKGQLVGEAPKVGAETMAVALMLADERLSALQDHADAVKQITELCARVLELSASVEWGDSQLTWLKFQLTHQHAQTVAQTATLEAEYQRRILELETLAGTPKRNGAQWTEFEESRLIKLYRAGKTEAQIARSLQRFGDAVCVRLGKLEAGDTWPRWNFESEQQWTQRHRDVFFRGAGSDLLGSLPRAEDPEHVQEAFRDTPEPTRVAA